MKIKKLVVGIVASIAAVFGFTACIDGGSNKYNYPYVSPALIEYDMQAGLVMNTYYGAFVPDNVSAANLSSLVGSCIYASFDYNSEYQTGQYIVASNINYVPAKFCSVRSEDSEDIRDYSFPFSSVELFTESCSSIYKGLFFAATIAKLDTNQELSYYLYTKSNEQPEADGATNIYLQAKLPGTTSGSKEITEIRALNMRGMVYSSGRDTTITQGGTSYELKYLKLNLKYCSEFKDNAPVFTTVTDPQTKNPQPIYIYVLKEDLNLY